MRACRLLVLAVLLVCPSGCGTGSGEVTGKVTFRGKPVTSGSVILYCPGNRIVRGVIGPDGSYSIPHVPAGEAAVAVRSPPVLPDGGYVNGETAPRGEAIPINYGVPDESGLTIRVGRGRVVYDIELNP